MHRIKQTATLRVRIMWSHVKARSKSGWNQETRVYEVMVRSSSSSHNTENISWRVVLLGTVFLTLMRCMCGSLHQHGRGLCSLSFCVLPLLCLCCHCLGRARLSVALNLRPRRAAFSFCLSMCCVLHRVFDSSHCRSRYKSEDSVRPTASNVALKFLDSAQLPSGASVSRNITRKDRVCFSMSSVRLFPCMCFISNEAVLLSVPSTLCFFSKCSFSRSSSFKVVPPLHRFPLLAYFSKATRKEQHTADTTVGDVPATNQVSNHLQNGDSLRS